MKSFTEKEKEIIVNTYKNCLSIRKTSGIYKTSDNKVKEILLEYDIDIHDPNCEYIKHKPQGYWNNRERCEEAAKTCRNRGEFYKRFVTASMISKKNGWLEDFDQYFSLEKQFYNYNDKIHIIYVYEINKTHSVYVGRTINLKRRHNEHKNGRMITSGKIYTDNLYKHCKENKTVVPDPIILEEGLTAIESQKQEKYWLDKYLNDGWNIINKGVTGEKSGSLGSNIKKWDYEACKMAAEQCVSKADYRKRFSTASRVSIQNKWINDFFDNKKKENGCFDTIDKCIEACKAYNKISDVKKCYPFLYHKICENKWNDEIIKILGWYKKGFDKKTPDFQKVNNNILKKKNIEIEKVDINQLSSYELGIYNIVLHRDVQKVINSEYNKNLKLLIDNKYIVNCITVKNNLEFTCGVKHMDMLNDLINVNKLGYYMITVYDSEVNDFCYIKNKILHILGLSNNRDLIQVTGRMCDVKEIFKSDAETFMNEFHIQGFVSGTVYVGCYYKDLLVSVMILKNGGISSKDEWEIVRFANDVNIISSGLFGKCFSFFRNKYNPNKVISFADRRWTIDANCNTYIKNEFIVDNINRPDFKYVDINTQTPILYHKMYFNKQKLHKKYGLPLTMTETEMAKELGYDRIWDCGLLKYVWTSNDVNEGNN